MSKHIPRKRFGQNFLQDASVIAGIVHAVNPQPDDIVIEIGPGLGAITKPLLSRLKHLHVVEIDRDIIERLRAEHPADKLTIHAGDALAFDFASVSDQPLKIVGNLPYNISTPLLFHLATYGNRVLDMHFMLQKEVIERMVAEPSTADYGRLSVMLQYRFYMENILFVPPEAFWPPPKVDSAVVRMMPAPGRCGVARDEALLEKLVIQAFAQRRKTLRNNLKGLADVADLEALGIDPGLRPENLRVEDYVRLANHLSDKGARG
ncbi:16S rRNA (adenine(1518)-N(6)/adenine(1519)-N(6))-dimethyltransferase RsmA [Chromobacterium piscinae]|uniref:16S rRNA (adenine(1518)-N(6)/adenine(1519)-N(6))- dimethyltransferase RsmA n=1 Tax=Chromobacterium piscinae TaxID=686831 RepID=UPI001C8BB706|nr:16S rRNA (adenine(1518)-N(6)/adenine(1519)-N(6))-dimethyltransferase RsmA [Chromobacterium piscinae]MBX9345976.1 16S rRNA (adenine(1518)-N(6)/adenine(1519)-N(6))-dimethyltransferase RsmA [Chromobacterium vaccinii]MCD5328381.1 16S rRNA (adenine(1518)-N(6)/adenine(1519)-N(6))-dimethyltransferase RsmA [Chromobacterium piscinae]